MPAALEPRARGVVDAAWRPAFERTALAALVDGVALSVYPLFSPDDEAPGKPAELVSLVDGVKQRKLVLLGVRSHGESELHLGPLTAALARKRVDFGLGFEDTKPWTLASWSRTVAREEVAELSREINKILKRLDDSRRRKGGKPTRKPVVGQA